MIVINVDCYILRCEEPNAPWEYLYTVACRTAEEMHRRRAEIDKCLQDAAAFGVGYMLWE